MPDKRAISGVSHRNITKIKGGVTEVVTDIIAKESALQLLINETPLTITMRTPGDDTALCAGFLWSERIITAPSDIKSSTQTDADILDMQVHQPQGLLTKSFLTNSSCGVCGKTALDEVRKISPFAEVKDNINIALDNVFKLPSILRNHQSSFNLTGGIHGCALFNTGAELIDFAEDVGRHNALDKLIGRHVLTDTLPLHAYILLLSGRISFELVQKADMAGIKIICGIGAPSDLAIDIAEAGDITLVGFLKSDSCNIYTHRYRITL